MLSCRAALMCDRQLGGVDDEQLSAQLAGIAYRRRRAAAPLSVVDCQHDGGIANEETIAFQHTVFLIGPVDEYDGIRLLQDGAIDLTGGRCPFRILSHARQDAMQFQRGIVFTESED